MSSSDTTARETSTPVARTSYTSYSLNYEDVILHRLFPQRQHGFYVDVGAGHPRFENDLYALYERGWNGINIEPNEGFFALYEQVRSRDLSLCMALSDVAGPPLTYYEIEGSGLSTCDQEQAKEHAARGHKVTVRSVPVGTLAGILADAGAREIDILKVDVEGFEQKVLDGNDWERFRPSVVLVEATYPESPERRPTKIRGFLEQRGYRHVLFDGLNDFYLEHSFPEPDGLTLPPNVFDGFVLREIAELREQVQALRTSFTSAETYAHSLKAASVDLQTRVDDLHTRYNQTLQSLEDVQRSHENALNAADALAKENRRLGQQTSNLMSAIRHWRSAAERMRAEITVLNQLLEPLHAVAEQMNQMRRGYEHELHLVRNDMQRQASDMQRQASDTQRQTNEMREMLQHRDAELRQLHADLQGIYASRSWLLTKPWRFVGRVVKRSRA